MSPEEIEQLRSYAPKLVEHIESVGPVEHIERLEVLKGPPTGLLRPYGLSPDTGKQRQDHQSAYDAERAREWRRDAVELAVHALTPLAGAYPSPETYGADIVNLAAQLGDYIQGK